MSVARARLTVDRRIVPGEVLLRGELAPYRALQLAAGEPHLLRSELADRGVGRATGGQGRPLCTFVHVTDLQIADVMSPVRFEFINREFEDPRFAHIVPVQRPQEALAPHAVDAVVRVVNGLGAGPWAGGPVELVVTTGDSIDNAQWNEVVALLSLFDGGRVDLTDGGAGYSGVQSPDWPDDIFWRPHDHPGAPLDLYRKMFGFPLLPGVLDAAVTPFVAPGLRLPWLACYGNHEALIQGVGVVTPALAAALVGGSKPTRMPDRIGHEDPLEVFVSRAETFMAGDPRQVRALADRRPVSRAEFVEAHFRTRGQPDGHGFTAENRSNGTAYYAYDRGPVRFVTLDTACLAGGHEGCLDHDQVDWLTRRLVEVHSQYLDQTGNPVRTANDDRMVVLLSHHGLDTLDNLRGGHPGPGGDRLVGAPELLALLHRFPNVVLWVNGHTHVNRVEPRPAPSGAGGFWEVTTCAVADWPCQARLVELVDDGDGTLSIACTMVDHDGPVTPAAGWPAAWSGPYLAGLHRELAANDPGAGFDSVESDEPKDRNVVLRVRAPFPLRSSISGARRTRPTVRPRRTGGTG